MPHIICHYLVSIRTRYCILDQCIRLITVPANTLSTRIRQFRRGMQHIEETGTARPAKLCGSALRLHTFRPLRRLTNLPQCRQKLFQN